MTPFDPKGSLGQVDKYTQGLPEDDALVQFVRKLRDLRLAVDKLASEKKAVRFLSAAPAVVSHASALRFHALHHGNPISACTYRRDQTHLVA